MVSRCVGVHASLSLASSHFSDGLTGLHSMDKTTRSAWGKRLLIFAGKFLLVSFPLFIIWGRWGDRYAFQVTSAVVFFVDFLGLPVSELEIPIEIFTSSIVFISLMLISRGVSLLPRLSKMIFGLITLFLWQTVANLALCFLQVSDYQSPLYRMVLTPSLGTFLIVFNIALPFLLWFLLIGKKRVKAAIL